MSLHSVIAAQIASNGPLTVSEYMQLALSHPEYGYYMRKDPLGSSGDFTTAPEISQIFGELLGAWTAQQWKHLNQPECALIELGPGRGTLMSDMLRATRHVQEFHDAISVHLVETSPAMKQKQWQALAGKHDALHWHESVDELPKDKPWLIVANEFFDALPIRQFLCQNGAWHERAVGSDDNGALTFTSMPLNTDSCDKQLKEFLGQFEPASLAAGDIVEYGMAAVDITSTIACHLRDVGGVALIVDYGYAGLGIGDTFQAVRTHRYHPPLRDPGQADLTAHVDFTRLAITAERCHAVAHGPVAQGAFLGRLGAIPRAIHLCEQSTPEQQANVIGSVRRLIDPDQMGELFKAMAITGGTHPTPEGFR
ncbi:MAG: class I SAM-dependent methyltransferase [Alphaproteobacteria bacterium]